MHLGFKPRISGGYWSYCICPTSVPLGRVVTWSIRSGTVWLCLRGILFCSVQNTGFVLKGEGIIGGGYTRLQAGNTSWVLTQSSSWLSTGINLCSVLELLSENRPQRDAMYMPNWLQIADLFLQCVVFYELICFYVNILCSYKSVPALKCLLAECVVLLLDTYLIPLSYLCGSYEATTSS